MKKGDKKRFEKAMHQLGSAFEKAKEVNTPMQKKMATDRVGQTWQEFLFDPDFSILKDCIFLIDLMKLRGSGF